MFNLFWLSYKWNFIFFHYNRFEVINNVMHMKFMIYVHHNNVAMSYRLYLWPISMSSNGMLIIKIWPKTHIKYLKLWRLNLFIINIESWFLLIRSIQVSIFLFRSINFDTLPTPWKTQMWVQVENNGKRKNQGAFLNSQHFEKVEGHVGALGWD
jgi:hypothetical protein